ncbi:GntR family transcriptional regulator [Amorphus sp. MBR-141]
MAAGDTSSIDIVKAVAPLRLQVVEGLRRAIISGRLQPGHRLTERELMAMMSVSRTVIREALRQLETEGLVAIVPNRGPIVRELTKAEANDLYQIRSVMEGFAARLFAENASEEDIARLEAELDAVEKAYADGETETILVTKNAFYRIMSVGAGSPTLAQMLDTLHARISRWRALGLSHPDRRGGRSAETVDNLRAVITAIKARDPDEAEARMRVETRQAAEEVRRLLG